MNLLNQNLKHQMDASTLIFVKSIENQELQVIPMILILISPF